MKKLLVLALVLSMAAAANAALIFVPSATEVVPSQNVTITVVDTSGGVMGGIMGFAIDAISDGGKGGACVSQSFPAWDKTYPGTIGGDGFLDEYWSYPARRITSYRNHCVYLCLSCASTSGVNLD